MRLRRASILIGSLALLLATGCSDDDSGGTVGSDYIITGVSYH